MKTITKRLLSLLLTFCMLSSLSTVSAAVPTPPDTVSPLYNNTASVYANMHIATDGLMQIRYSFSGLPVATKLVITTSLERKNMGFFWQTVEIGRPNNQWVDTCYDIDYRYTRNFRLPKKGTYRVKILFQVYGRGGAADEIPYSFTDTY